MTMDRKAIRYWERGRRYNYAAIDEVTPDHSVMKTIAVGLTNKLADSLCWEHNAAIDQLLREIENTKE